MGMGYVRHMRKRTDNGRGKKRRQAELKSSESGSGKEIGAGEDRIGENLENKK